MLCSVVFWFGGAGVEPAPVALEVVVVVVVMTGAQGIADGMSGATDELVFAFAVSQIPIGEFAHRPIWVSSDCISLVAGGVTDKPSYTELQGIGCPVEELSVAPLKEDGSAAFADSDYVACVTVSIDIECRLISDLECCCWFHYETIIGSHLKKINNFFQNK